MQEPTSINASAVESLTSGAEKAVEAFGEVTNMFTAGEDNQTVMQDLLNDLAHWADLNGVSFAQALSAACASLVWEHPAADDIPDDPEEMNDERAEWAYYAVNAFADAVGYAGERDSQVIMVDLLKGLSLWSAENEVKFSAALVSAAMHYEHETAEVA